MSTGGPDQFKVNFKFLTKQNRVKEIMFHARTSKKLKNSQFENLNDAYIISMPMFATQLVHKIKMERIIVFNHEKS